MIRPRKYICKYSYSFDIKKNAKISREYAACFSKLYTEMPRGGKYNLNVSLMIYTENVLNSDEKDNYCILSPRQLNEYIKFVEEVCGVKIIKSRSMKCEQYKCKYNRIDIQLRDKSYFDLKLVTTLMRNTYEWTFNLQLKTAFLMKKIKEFKNLDLSQRLCVAINTIYNSNSGHSSYIDDVKLTNKNELIDRISFINRNNIRNVNYLYEHPYRSVNKYLVYDNDSYIATKLESNVINDEFKKELIKNYNLMKI